MLKFLRYLLITFVILSITVFMFMQQPSFGKLPSGSRLEKIETSSNFKDTKFKNLTPTNTLAEGVSYFSVLTEFFGKGVDREPLEDLPSVKTDLKKLEADVPVIVWFGHSTFLIKVRGKSILIDPVLSMRPSPVQFAGSKSYPGTRVYAASDFPDPDVVIITHDHYDHLDYKTISDLKSRTNLFCVPLGVGEHLEHWGVEPARILEFDWWESKTIADNFELIATPARHFSGRGFQRDRTLWSSYVLKTGEHTIFLGGDSGYDEAFTTIGEKYGPFDIALLECGQYDAKWPNIHMMPEETVQASIDLKAKVLMPIHWGKFTLGLHPWKEPIERITREAGRLQVTLATPMIGEPLYVGKDIPQSRWWE